MPGKSIGEQTKASILSDICRDTAGVECPARGFGHGSAVCLRLAFNNWYHINSGCIGINITQNQDTAVPCPYARLIVGKRHCRVLACHSGAAGIDIRRPDSDTPKAVSLHNDYFKVGKRHCRVLRCLTAKQILWLRIPAGRSSYYLMASKVPRDL